MALFFQVRTDLNGQAVVITITEQVPIWRVVHDPDELINVPSADTVKKPMLVVLHLWSPVIIL
eukprot:2652048-Prorocentrum_lima.AAC.1